MENYYKEMVLDNWLPSLLLVVNGAEIIHEHLKRSVVDRAFGVPHVIAELLFVFLLIHNYQFLCHFNVTFLILISRHDPARHLLLAQVRGFFIVLTCWKSPWANTHLEANIPSGSIQQPGVPWGEGQNLQHIHAVHSGSQNKRSPSLSVSEGDLPASFTSQEANTSSKRNL